MNKETAQIDERLSLAVELARAGGDETLRFFRKGSLEIDTKRDGTPVTAADRACESLIRNRLAAAFPEDGVLGEEFGESAGSTGFRWILDPIDGTFSFLNGVPLYTTLIGLESDPADGGRMVAGVIHAPALDETVYARLGGGAWRVTNGSEPARAMVSTTATLSEATVATTALEYWDESTTGVWLRIASTARHTRGWPDAYAALLIATGRCDALIEPALQCWDIAPFGPILAEAGGRSTDWSGIETAHAGAVVASNGSIHGELLSLVRV